MKVRLMNTKTTMTNYLICKYMFLLLFLTILIIKSVKKNKNDEVIYFIYFLFNISTLHNLKLY